MAETLRRRGYAGAWFTRARFCCAGRATLDTPPYSTYLKTGS